MSGRFVHIVRCIDLQEHDVSGALGARERTAALLEHLAAISAPDTGAAKALIVFARMATTACDWIDGDLCIDLVGEAASTTIEAVTQLGGGLRERLLPPTRMRVPIGEFARAIDRVPHMVAPLVVRARSAHRVSLSATDHVRRTTGPPPPIEIATASLFVRAPSVVALDPEAIEPPAASLTSDVDAGWDD
jgi:hypothetical protein